MKQWTQSRKTRVSPKGWVHGNAPCCVHNGETKDTRGRGGFKVEEASGGLVYSCFNCGFKAGYTPGRKLYHKTRRLMSWMGISENDINRMVIEAMRIRDMTGFVHVEPKEYEEPNFKERPLPPESLSIEQWAVWSSLEDTLQDPTAWPSGLEDAADYAYERFGEDT